MPRLLAMILSAVMSAGCASPPAQESKPAPAPESKKSEAAPAAASDAPKLRSDLRLVSIPVAADQEEIAFLTRTNFRLDVLAGIAAGAGEPVIVRVVPGASLIAQARGPDPGTRTVSLIVPAKDVDKIYLIRDLAARRQANFYLAAGSGEAPTASDGRPLHLRDLLIRLGIQPSAPAVDGAAAPAARPVAAKAERNEMPDALADGQILIDGSSTVFPLSKLAREEFLKRFPNVRIDLMGTNPGESPGGTGGGFKKFCFGETDFSNASRFVSDDEMRKCAANNVAFHELPVAYDGLSIVVHRDNTWIDNVTMAELKKIFEQNSRIRTWKDLRPGLPERPIKLFAPGRDSGTFDYFAEVVLGKGVQPRQDLVASEDDEVLAKGVATDPDALGYFGLAYYVNHKNTLKQLTVDGGKGPVRPSEDTVGLGTYPLSRPLLVYVNTRSFRRPEVEAFLRYFLNEAPRIAQAVGYIPLPPETHRLSIERFRRRAEGSMRPLGKEASSLRIMMSRE